MNETYPTRHAASPEDLPPGAHQFTIRDTSFMVNGAPLFVRGFRPDRHGQATPALLRTLKNAGFNLIHLQPGTEAQCAAAEAAGLMVLADLRVTPATSIRETVQSLCNQPSVAAWLVHGEREEDCEAVRSLDPSRPIIHGRSDYWSSFLHAQTSHADPFAYFALALPEPFGRQQAQVLERLGERGAPLLVTVKCGGTPAAETAQERWSGPFSALRSLRINESVSGFVLEAAASMLDDSISALQQVNAEVVLLARPERESAGTEERLDLEVSCLIEGKQPDFGELTTLVTGPTSQVLWKKKKRVPLKKGRQKLWSGAIRASKSPGRHRFTARLTAEGKPLSEDSFDFIALAPEPRTEMTVRLREIHEARQSPGERIAALSEVVRGVYVVPPLANTIRAYPIEALDALAQAHEGAACIVFQPPQDWNELADRLDESLSVHREGLRDSGTDYYHIAAAHPVFDGVTRPGRLDEPWADLVPACGFRDSSEEDVSSLVFADGNSTLPTILVKRYGNGRVIFTDWRLIDELNEDSLAAGVRDNLLRHAARRAVVSDEKGAVPREAAEWLRDAGTGLRRWQVALNSSFATHPETPLASLDWRDWYLADTGALEWRSIVRWHFGTFVDQCPGTVLARAELIAGKRSEGLLTLESDCPVSVRVNNEAACGRGNEDATEWCGQVRLRQGRNTLLLACAYTPGGGYTRVEIGDDPAGARLSWWR